MTSRIQALVMVLVAMRLGGICAAQILSPTVTVTMSRYGWRQVPIVGPESRIPFDTRRVVFGPGGDVYAGLLIPDPVKLRTRTAPSSTFRVIELRTGTGKVEHIWNLRTNAKQQDSLYLSGRGSLVALADDGLRMLTGSRTGATFSDSHIDWVRQSTSRRTLAVYADPPKAHARDQWVLDSDKLAVIAHCALRTRWATPVSISDSGYLASAEGPEMTAARGQIVPVPENFCGPPDSLAPPDFHGTRAFMYYAADDAIVIGLGDHSFEVWRFPNTLLFSARLHKHEEYDPYTIRIAANGSRAGVLVTGEKGGSKFFDVDPRPISIRIDVLHRVWSGDGG